MNPWNPTVFYVRELAVLISMQFCQSKLKRRNLIKVKFLVEYTSLCALQEKMIMDF